MKIAITADPVLPVPPAEYGGIERIIHLLVCGLVEKGHSVTLFAHGRSEVPCRLISYPARDRRSALESSRIASTIAVEILRDGFDLVHSFGRLGYLIPILPFRIPKLMTYQRAITAQRVALGYLLSRGSLSFSAVSRKMISGNDLRGNWSIVYNGVSEERYVPRRTPPADAPLIFLGRIERIKGTHIAIEVARQSGRRLTIAGNVSPGVEHQQYFDDEIAPHLDGDRIRYVGPVDDVQKNALLGESIALLMPIQWEEPFGIVMAEALACGTPVVGFARGSVPEVVNNGVNGFVCANVAEMIEAVGRLDHVNRSACRRIMEERFSATAMVDAYENVYFHLTATDAPARGKLIS